MHSKPDTVTCSTLNRATSAPGDHILTGMLHTKDDYRSSSGANLNQKTPVKPGNVFKLLYRDSQEKIHYKKHLKRHGHA